MTIKEVAQMAQVSPAAVSRYLNGGSLSEEKRVRIRQAIQKTGYRPDVAAQTLRTGRVNQIGVIVPKLHSESVSQVVGGISDALSDKGFLTLLGNTGSREERELRYLEVMQENHVAGIILMGTSCTPAHEEAFAACSVPLVITGQNFPNMPCVYHDDRNAARELAARMTARGRRHIGYIGVKEKDPAAGLARRMGVQDALRAAGLDADAMPRLSGSFDQQSGYSCMTELLAIDPAMDGVVCATDTIALGAMSALKKLGRRVPEDISIAGVGDSWAGTITDPPLTTAHLYYTQCGTDAAKMLLHLIEDGKDNGPVRRTMLGYTIVDRGSI